MRKNKNNIGSSFEEFLADDGILEECRATAIKFKISHELEKAMRKSHVSKMEMARRLKTSRTGLDRLLDRLAEAMPEGPHLYPDDELTDLSDRLLAAELVREQIFLQTHEEVPYAATVETESWQERKDGSVRIEATVYVARPGHKAILIGERGARIREIGARARAELSRLLERPVHLFLNVKERAGWDEEAARLRALGLEDPS